MSQRRRDAAGEDNPRIIPWRRSVDKDSNRELIADRGPVDVTALDGRAYAKFLAAGTYFLTEIPPGPQRSQRLSGARRRHRYEYVPDRPLGHAGSRQASRCAAAPRWRRQPRQGSLMGARGNSGVIISQMLRGFAHHVRHRTRDRHVHAGDRACAKRLARPVKRCCGRSRARSSRSPRRRPMPRTTWRFTSATSIALPTACCARRTRRWTGRPSSCPCSKKPASSIRAAPDSCTSSRAFCDFCPT